MKAIVYSEVDSCIPLLTDLSAELDFKLCVLSGFQTSRAASLESFKAEGRRAVLFASAMTDCSGIDLPNTTDIILWHKLPPATEQQVIGRSRRVSTSSSHQTTIHHLYRENWIVKMNIDIYLPRIFWPTVSRTPFVSLKCFFHSDHLTRFLSWRNTAKWYGYLCDAPV